MATLKEVQQRIAGIRNTQKITRAMKIVAATKHRKFERLRKAASVYSGSVEKMLHDIVRYTFHPYHPLLHEREKPSHGGILVIGSDRGLCGAFNSNLFRKTVDFIKAEAHCSKIEVIAVGKKTRDFFHKNGYTVLHDETEIEKRPLHDVAKDITALMVKAFMQEKVHKWCIISNRFTNRSSFEFSHDVLLPVTVGKEVQRDDSLYICEDAVAGILDYLVPLYVRDLVYSTIVESMTAEELSRMMAMDHATENADELIGELTLFYNRTRQQVITKEISEIVGGAEALANA